MTRRAAVLLVGLGALLSAPPAAVGEAVATPPDTFSVVAKAAPAVVQAAFPAVLPLQVEAGLAATSLRIGSQPLASAAAAPLSVPVLGALPQAADVAALVDCTAASPGDRMAADCGGPGQDVTGVGRLGVASGHAEVETDGQVRARAESGMSEVGTGPGAIDLLQLRGLASEVAAATEGASIVGRARASVGGVTIGGVVRVAAIETVAEGRLSAGAEKPSLTFDAPTFGLEVADVPVTVDGDGVHVADVAVPGLQTQLQGVVNQTLEGLGLVIDLVPGEVEQLSEDGTRLRATTPGLRITFADPASGNQLAVVLGRLELTMAASRFDELAPLATTDEPPLASDAAPSVPLGASSPVARPAATNPTEPAATNLPTTPAAALPPLLDLEDWLPVYAALLTVAACGPLVVVARTRIAITPRRRHHG
jgi:hypothetical protein